MAALERYKTEIVNVRFLLDKQSHAHICSRMHARTYVRTHARTHTHTHTHTGIHTHVQVVTSLNVD